LRERIELLKASEAPQIDGSPIAATRGIVELYERRRYAPAWTEPEMVFQLYDAVLRSVEHGLNPGDFHAGQIATRLHPAPDSENPMAIADSEVLLTDAFARLVVTLHFGKLDPASLDPAWNFSRSFATRDPVHLFNEALTSGQIKATIEGADPDFEQYRRLRRALRIHRALKAAGGWSEVPSGAVLEIGSSGPRVASLRQRLAVTGDFQVAESSDPEVFDEELETAVRRFQERHGLSVDGKVGPGSLAALNVSIDERIDQIRATMERIRWVFRDIPDNFVVVDIAGFNLTLYKNRVPIWNTRVQVGKPYHATPVFRDRIQYLEINPTWTIPPGILRNQTLPQIRKDPEYLSRNNMSVMTTSGTVVDPTTIDWAATTGGFPYMVRQEPGPHNALGRIKFMFPNKHMVYLHDTPSKGLFAQSERAFSHGCIRVENPFELARLLLEDLPGWDRDRIDQVVASRSTTRVDLAEPMPVMLLYWTVEVTENGTVHFRKDVYNRDQAILKGLDDPYLVSPPEGSYGSSE
jgi:murein L,D-transpeptidase YcbB/YkuD